MTTEAAKARYRRYQESDKGQAMLARRKPVKAAYDAARYASNPEPAIRRAQAAVAANPDGRRRYARRHWLRQYGLTDEDYREMLVGQAARCLVCGLVMEPGPGTHVDHDHTTGKVRGLLCGPCNRMLGLSRDNPETLRAGAAYLERSR